LSVLSRLGASARHTTAQPAISLRRSIETRQNFSLPLSVSDGMFQT
jgi:hypothetical protein